MKSCIQEDQPAWSPALRTKTAIRTSPIRHFVDPSIAVAALGTNPEGLLKDFNTFGLRGNAEIDRVNALPEIILQEHWKKAQVIAPDASGEGAHGGGDIRLLNNIFRGVKDDPLGHAAGYLDGAASILTGIAANISIKTGAPVNVADLVRF